MRHCVFIEMYDRIPCTIQSLLVIITDISQYHPICHHLMRLHNSYMLPCVPTIALRCRGLPDNSPTPIPTSSYILPATYSCHNTTCSKVLMRQSARLSFQYL